MGKVYKNQNLKVNMSTDVTLAPGDGLEIVYLKPDGITKGTWPATYVDINNVFYEVPKNTLDMVGDWRCWLQLITETTIEDYPGEFDVITVYERGS